MNKNEVVQASLNGVWRKTTDGCPHRHGCKDWVDLCDANEMRPCVYETAEAINGCELFRQILDEWRIEFGICPECFQVRPGDERVKAGMKCGVCAGYADPYEECLRVGVMPGNLEKEERND